MSKVAKMAVAVALVAMGASGAKAASADKPSSDQAIERSYAIQAELARIEADKEAFVDELLASWTPYVDRETYDLASELNAKHDCARDAQGDIDRLLEKQADDDTKRQR